MLVNGAAIKLTSADGDDLRNLLTFMFNGLKQRSTFAVVIQSCDGKLDSMALNNGQPLAIQSKFGDEIGDEIGHCYFW